MGYEYATSIYLGNLSLLISLYELPLPGVEASQEGLTHHIIPPRIMEPAIACGHLSWAAP